jgi:hypothetical protein
MPCLFFFQKEANDKPTQLAQNEDSWNRTVTLPPSVREVFHLDPQAPKDSLDIPDQKQKDGIHTIENGISKSIYQKNLNIPLSTEDEIPSSTEDIIDDNNNNNNNIEDDIIELSAKDEIPSSTEDIIDDNNNINIEDDIIELSAKDEILSSTKDVIDNNNNNNINIEDDIIEVKSSLQIYTFNPVDFNWQMNRCPIIKLVVHSTSYPVYKSDNMVIGIPKDKKTIRGDGNCFFRSISFALTGNEDHHLEVRKCVVEHILFLGDKIKSFLQANHTAKSYIKNSNMTKSGIWASEVEIFATAHLLKTDIYIYGKSGKTFSWLKFSAAFIDSTVVSSDKAIYLNHTNGNHYDVVKSTSIVDITEKGQNKKRKASPEFGKDCLSKKRRTNEKGLNKKRKVSPEFGKDHLNKNRRTN